MCVCDGKSVSVAIRQRRSDSDAVRGGIGSGSKGRALHKPNNAHNEDEHEQHDDDTDGKDDEMGQDCSFRCHHCHIGSGRGGLSIVVDVAISDADRKCLHDNTLVGSLHVDGAGRKGQQEIRCYTSEQPASGHEGLQLGLQDRL